MLSTNPSESSLCTAGTVPPSSPLAFSCASVQHPGQQPASPSFQQRCPAGDALGARILRPGPG